METTTIEVEVNLRNKLTNKKNDLKFKKLGDVVQAMYNLITKHKMWEELKEVKK